MMAQYHRNAADCRTVTVESPSKVNVIAVIAILTISDILSADGSGYRRYAT